MSRPLAITGLGMITPVGLHAPECFHSIRASTTRLNLVRFADYAHEWLVGATAMTWVPGVQERRLVTLAERALREAWADASRGRDPDSMSPLAAVFGAPEPERPGYAFPSEGFDLEGWLKGMGLRCSSTRVLRGGHCSSQLALRYAANLLERGDARACIVGAVDSQLQLRTLRWHERNRRLKCSYVRDGLIPGEAACFLVVERESTARAGGARTLATILSVGTAREPAGVLTDHPNTARGLTAAVRAALNEAGIRAPDLSAVWCDLNGESYRAREWAFTEIRMAVPSHTELMHPADCHGDLGAATDANLLALAAQSQASGWAGQKPVLVFSGSEGGIRAATVVAPPPTANGRAGLHVSLGEPRLIETDVRVPELGPDESDPTEDDDPPRAYFDWELRQEHLGDAATLYDQRRALLASGEIPWPRLREPEQRMLAHLDAAAGSGSAAIWAVASGLLADDAGSCFAGALMLAMVASESHLERIEQAWVRAGEKPRAGIEDALRHAPSSPFLGRRLGIWLAGQDVAARALAASLMGYRREGDPARIAGLLTDGAPRVRAAAASALRRFRHEDAASSLERLLSDADPGVIREVALALTVLGSGAGAARCRELCRSASHPEWAPLVLAVGGVEDDLDLLLEARRRGAGGPALGALGVLGNVEAIPRLIEALNGPEPERPAAGEALELLTGAGLIETATVTEGAEAPDDAEPERKEVRRPSTSAEEWSRWWRTNASRLPRRTRLRRGRPFHPGLILAELRDPDVELASRERAGWELQIHAGRDFSFEPDGFVARQERTLAAAEAWWAGASRRPK